jgi:hypothetical protein
MAAVPMHYHARMPLPRSLCFTLAEMASRTWELLGRSQQARIAVSEETITDTILIDLQSRHPSEVVTYKFSRQEEGQLSGADWEWWLNGGGNWLGIRIQAKKIDHNREYPGLSRPTPSGILQVDLLIQSSQKDGLYPLYCFYNFWGPPLPIVPWNCFSFAPSLSALGCTIAAATAIQPLATAKTNTLAAIAPIARPWNCLFCCAGFADPNDNLPVRALALLNALPSAQRPLTDLLRTSPPEYVQAIISGATPPTTPAPDISHIVIVSEAGLRA